MERRVKIVWILTLVSGLLLICGQGYWLFNQYRYQMDEYIKESYETVLEVIGQEQQIRKELAQEGKALQQSYVYLSGEKEDLEKKEGVLRELGIELTVHDLDSIRRAPALLPSAGNEASDTSFASRHLSFSIYDGEEDKRIVNEQKEFYYLVGEEAKTHLHEVVEVNGLQIRSPFVRERFDSLLDLRLGKANYTLQDTVYMENTIWVPAIQPRGSSLRPVLEVIYPYDPLRRRGITLQIATTYHPVLKRMGWQLAGSLGLILLLLVSMLFQATTVVKQYRVDTLRKSFVHTMIHELRRPVQTLKMWVALLRDQEMRGDEQAIGEVLRDSMFELDNLSAYLGKLKDMTQADYEDTPLQKVSFDLKELVEKVIRLTPRPADKNIRFVPVYDMQQSCVTADPVHVANVIQNLIENSIKYSDGEVEIGIDCRLYDGKLEITVSDNGFGIPATEQTYVFDKFYRGRQAAGSDIPGIGLGLSYVKLITEAHQGEVSLRTEPGKGTAITLRIPQYCI